MQLPVTIKEAAALVKKAGWTPEQFARGIKVDVETAARFLESGNGLGFEETERFERWAASRIGYCNSPVGYNCDRPSQTLTMGEVIAPPVILPDEALTLSEVRPLSETEQARTAHARKKLVADSVAVN